MTTGIMTRVRDHMRAQPPRSAASRKSRRPAEAAAEVHRLAEQGALPGRTVIMP